MFATIIWSGVGQLCGVGVLYGVVTINIIIAVYWVIVFINRMCCSIKYKRGAARCITDEEASYLNTQICYHYETEIRKYYFLLAITFTEMFALIVLCVTVILQVVAIDPRNYNSMIESSLNKCTVFRNTSAYNQVIYLPTVFIYANGFNAILNSSELFILSFSVCLMNYLILRMKQIKQSRRFNPFIYLIVTILISSVTVITAFIQVTFIVNIILVNISMFVYCGIFVKMSNKFKRALLQKSLERLCQHGSNKEELQQYKYFKYSINTICFAYILTSIATSMLYFRLVIVCILYYGNCYFPFNFLPPPEFIIQSEEANQLIMKLLDGIAIVGNCTLCVSLFLWLFPLFILSVCTWMKQISKYFKQQPSEVRYNSIVDLEAPLLKSTNA